MYVYVTNARSSNLARL